MKTKKRSALMFSVMLILVLGFSTSVSARVEEEGGETGPCEMTQDCSGNMCSILNAKKRFFANGCIKKCDYTCTVQSIPSF